MKQLLRKYGTLNDLLLLIALFVALTLAWNTVSAMQRNHRLQQQYDALEYEVELQELENQNLRYSIEYLKSEGYLELAARDKFSKANSGETMVYLPDTGERQSPVAKSSPRPTGGDRLDSSKSNFWQWVSFFRGE